METLLILLAMSAVMIVVVTFVGFVIDLLTGGRILRKKSYDGWLKQTMDYHQQLLEEQKQIEQQWQEIEKEIREQTRKQH